MDKAWISSAVVYPVRDHLILWEKTVWEIWIDPIIWAVFLRHPKKPTKNVLKRVGMDTARVRLRKKPMMKQSGFLVRCLHGCLRPR